MKLDKILQSVLASYIQRARAGQEKYGTTMDRNDLDFEQWITHAQEEAMDLTLYLEKLKVVHETELRKQLDIKNNVIRQQLLLIKDLETELKHLRMENYNKEKRSLI